jgi:hypothetical protein
MPALGGIFISLLMHTYGLHIIPADAAGDRIVSYCATYQPW